MPLDPHSLLDESAGPGGPLVSREPTIEYTTDEITRALARAYQPVVVVARKDLFWPVPVATALDMSSNGATTCLSTRQCPPPVVLTELLPQGDPADYLLYPISPDKLNLVFNTLMPQLGLDTSFEDWIGGPASNPSSTAQIYFFRSNRSPPGDPEAGTKVVNLQYWFFYPFNYQPLELALPHSIRPPGAFKTVNYHQGDFEHISVLLRVSKAKGKSGKRYTVLEPRNVFMARHEDEGKWLDWPSDVELIDETHPVVYAAIGGHASYEHCGPHARRLEKEVLGMKLGVTLRENTACGRRVDGKLRTTEKAFAFSPRIPLVELKPTSWACWPGRFGNVWKLKGILSGVRRWFNKGTRLIPGFDDIQEALRRLTAGPLAPLRQFENSFKSQDPVCSANN